MTQEEENKLVGLAEWLPADQHRFFGPRVFGVQINLEALAFWRVGEKLEVKAINRVTGEVVLAPVPVRFEEPMRYTLGNCLRRWWKMRNTKV